MVCCADCGAPMTRKIIPTGGRKYTYYICSENKRDKHMCSAHRISEKVLADAVLQAVKEHIENVLMLEDAVSMMEEAPETAANVQKYKGRISEKMGEVEKIKKRKLRLYEDLKDGILSRDEYDKLKAQYSKRISEGEDVIKGFEDDLQRAIDNQTDLHLWIEEFKKHRGICELSRSDVIHMIERIDVTDAKHIEVRFRFIEEYEGLLKEMETKGREAI